MLEYSIRIIVYTSVCINRSTYVCTVLTKQVTLYEHSEYGLPTTTTLTEVPLSQIHCIIHRDILSNFTHEVTTRAYRHGRKSGLTVHTSVNDPTGPLLMASNPFQPPGHSPH